MEKRMWIVVQVGRWLKCRAIDETYTIHDIDVIKKVNRSLGTPVVAVFRLKENK
jgi:hypothetical protein